MVGQTARPLIILAGASVRRESVRLIDFLLFEDWGGVVNDEDREDKPVRSYR